MAEHHTAPRRLSAAVLLAALSLGACTDLDAALKVMEVTATPERTAPVATSKPTERPASSVKIVQQDEDGRIVVTRNETRERGTHTIRRSTGGNSIVIRQTQR